jgi:hypothetical protein
MNFFQSIYKYTLILKYSYKAFVEYTLKHFNGNKVFRFHLLNNCKNIEIFLI